MIDTEMLKAYATDFFPCRNDLMVAYAVLNFYKAEYSGPQFSNLDCSFSNVIRLIEKNYSKLSV